MKKMSKILALTLALAMLLCLCACGGSGTRSASSADFETRLREAQEKMAGLESMHMDMNMDVTMDLSIMGQSQSMDMRVYYVMDVQTNPNRSKLVMTSSSMGQTQEMTMYTDENNMVYVSNDGRNWQRQSSQSVDTSTMDPDTMLQLMLKNTSGFRETGKETINGSQATVYSGELSGDYVKEAFDMTGLGSSLGSLLGTGDVSGLFDNLGTIPMTVAIDDESGLVVRYTMDMAVVMENLMKNLFDMMLESQGMSGVKIEIKIGNCLATATLSQFNSVPEIVIPAEAKG